MQYAELLAIAQAEGHTISLEDIGQTGVLVGFDDVEEIDREPYNSVPTMTRLSYHIKVDDVRPNDTVRGKLALETNENIDGVSDYWLLIPKEAIEDFEAIKGSLPDFSDSIPNDLLSFELYEGYALEV